MVSYDFLIHCVENRARHPLGIPAMRFSTPKTIVSSDPMKMMAVALVGGHISALKLLICYFKKQILYDLSYMMCVCMSVCLSVGRSVCLSVCMYV